MKAKPDKRFASIFLAVFFLYFSLFFFLSHFLLFFFVFFFSVFLYFSFRYFRTLFFSFSPSCYSRISAHFLRLPGMTQVGLIIVQMFFKEWITRSIFTASFSLSSSLSSFSFPRFASWLCFLMHSKNKRDSGRSKLFTNVISFTPAELLYVYNFLSCLRCVTVSAFFLRFLVLFLCIFYLSKGKIEDRF